jgi:hypothetical protein
MSSQIGEPGIATAFAATSDGGATWVTQSLPRAASATIHPPGNELPNRAAVLRRWWGFRWPRHPLYAGRRQDLVPSQPAEDEHGRRPGRRSRAGYRPDRLRRGEPLRRGTGEFTVRALGSHLQPGLQLARSCLVRGTTLWRQPSGEVHPSERTARRRQFDAGGIECSARRLVSQCRRGKHGNSPAIRGRFRSTWPTGNTPVLWPSHRGAHVGTGTWPLVRSSRLSGWRSSRPVSDCVGESWPTAAACLA